MRRTCCIYNDIKRFIHFKSFQYCCGYTLIPGNGKLVFMLASQDCLCQGFMQNEGNKETKLSVSQYKHSICWSEMYLLKDFVCCGKRFDKNRFFVFYVFRHYEKILHGKGGILCQSAVFTSYTKCYS